MTIQQGNPTELGSAPASTGIKGLDEILRGGLPRDEMHLVQGGAGTGKTTLGLQFLLAGVNVGESGLYITLSQTKRGLTTIANSHGWSMDGVAVHELSPSGIVETIASHQTVLHTTELELGELTEELRQRVEQVKPRRVVFDSIGVIGLLAGNASRYHREIVALRQFLTGQGCTAIFLGDWPAESVPEGPANTEFHTIAGSLIHLDQKAPDYGDVRRRLRIIKVRGVPFDSGYHNFRIGKDGIEVYPRLGRYDVGEYTDFLRLESGIPPLDKLLGGGLEQGTTCLFVGPPGSGKSTLGAVYCRAAAERGDRSAIFLFEERPETFKARSKGVRIDLGPHLESGRIKIHPIRPAEISPGEFAQKVRLAVEESDAKVVMIDSITGYFNAMGNTPMLVVQMHEVLSFLSRRGVLTMLLVSKEGFMTVGSHSSLDVSYLSDSVILLQMFEAQGSVRRCIAAIKKRQGEHETSIRELFIQPDGVSISEEPLRQFQNLLSGGPTSLASGRSSTPKGRYNGGKEPEEVEGGDD
jgi:circadian clock protein KaiC